MNTRKIRKPTSATRPKSTLLKVVILGDGGVGKSCLMSRFVNDYYDPASFHTIGVEFLNKDIQSGATNYTLQIWDTAGQERFKSLRTPFYRGSDICMLTFAIDNRQSFLNIPEWKREFLAYADIREDVNFPFIVVGNKVDLGTDEREVTTEEGVQWCRANGECPYVETSAKDTTNVNEAFNLAVETWTKMEEKLEKPYVGETVNLNGGQGAGISSSCC